MIVVIDASVVVKWYVPEEFAAEADTLAADEIDLHTPELLISEFGNIIWKKCRKGELTLAEAETIAAKGIDRHITYHSHVQLFETALTGALDTGQTVYDWTYFSLALALSAPFVTADRRFYNALLPTKFRDNLIWIGDAAQLI